MTKPLYSLIILLLILISCKTNTKKAELIVDAGSFLDTGQAKEIANKLRIIDKNGVYHLFLYTVIAEKYYNHKNYDEYVFSVISKNDT